jgi:hypothetical protein
MCCQGIIKEPHVVNKSWPLTKHKHKPHVKVTYNHNILCCPPLSAQMLHVHMLRHSTTYMRPIYGTYAILEVWIEPTTPQSRVDFLEF